MSVHVPTCGLAQQTRLIFTLWLCECRNQGPAPLEDGVVLTESEFDTMSKQNVERWVAAHIIPVRRGASPPRPEIACANPLSQHSPISLDTSAAFATLLEGTRITIGVVDGDGDGDDDAGIPDWARVVVNDDVRITSMHKVRLSSLLLLLLPRPMLWHTRTYALNNVLPRPVRHRMA